jgi:predicted nucleic acid-binding protein
VILVDTSVWIDHLRSGDPKLAPLLHDGHVLAHPWVIGELALGHLSRRSEILGLLHNLPQATVATDVEVLTLIDNHRLFGLGIGYVDAHLLAATLLTTGAKLWTRDKRLAAVAAQRGLASDNGQAS